ncbi:MAG: AmmeMemoRadiSam system protein B [Acidobacteria bacterium]|nr:AmmeMemoRadiSam system protein B [Acidobacteriota bacterium]
MIRRAAVAGSFYPAEPEVLGRDVDRMLREARPRREEKLPRALIVPHAGYVYSGSVAAEAYRLLESHIGRINRVLLLGPSHFVPFDGHAVPASDGFMTPLGTVELDAEGRDRLSELDHVIVSDLPHQREHSLEVQLPFLQRIFESVPLLLPVAVGTARAEQTAEIIRSEWNRDGTLVLISTDLSHYLPYDDARRADARTAEAIRSFDFEAIRDRDACGRYPLRGALLAAKEDELTIHELDLRNSGDTAGPRSEVVGYGAWVIN